MRGATKKPVPTTCWPSITMKDEALTRARASSEITRVYFGSAKGQRPTKRVSKRPKQRSRKERVATEVPKRGLHACHRAWTAASTRATCTKAQQPKNEKYCKAQSNAGAHLATAATAMGATALLLKTDSDKQKRSQLSRQHSKCPLGGAGRKDCETGKKVHQRRVPRCAPPLWRDS